MLAAQFYYDGTVDDNTDTIGILLEHGSNVNAKDEQAKIHTVIVTLSIYPYIKLALSN